MERVMIFIDGSNFYHGLKTNNCSTRIDFLKLSQLLTGANRKLIRTYYYNAAYKQSDNPQKYADQLKFFTALKKTPYLAVELGRLEKRVAEIDQDWLKKGLGKEIASKVIEFLGKEIVYYTEKGVDIKIASDMLKLAYNNSYDTVILVSGDGDFVPAVKGVQDLGKHVENAYFERGHSDYLFETCDNFILLNSSFISKCLLF
ncbi:MAG: NYN domain-containing protein [Candidatus Aerophobetes bacterium]|nr:NYN domain-containing protein [Candidatus Aerophobetes bacterium]